MRGLIELRNLLILAMSSCLVFSLVRPRVTIGRQKSYSLPGMEQTSYGIDNKRDNQYQYTHSADTIPSPYTPAIGT